MGQELEMGPSELSVNSDCNGTNIDREEKRTLVCVRFLEINVNTEEIEAVPVASSAFCAAGDYSNSFKGTTVKQKLGGSAT